MNSRVETLKRQIAELDSLIGQGVLTSDAARTARARLEAELLAEVVGRTADGASAPEVSAPRAAATLEVPSPDTAPARMTTRDGDAARSGRDERAAAPPSFEAPVAARPSRRLVGSLALGVLAFGVAGYAWLGSREGLAVGPGSAAEAASSPHAAGAEQIESMVDRLAQRLKERPDDADGWAMLGRSYVVMGRRAEALEAFKKVASLRPKDGQALADLADAQATIAGSLSGEPERLVEKALAADPDNPKALSLAATVAFNRGDMAAAARQWERALRRVDPNTDFGKQIQGALDEARERGGLASASASSPSGPLDAALGKRISGRVTLTKDLAASASPEDTVFVFARPPGGGMPLAIVRRQVKDLPLDFVLDDAQAMNPAMKLSSVREVVVGARVSKSGNAIAARGDLQSTPLTVSVGAEDVHLEIGQRVP